MKELTLERDRYAEDDYSAVEQLFITGKNPPYGIVCFHAQQCVEKYLKAFLTEHDLSFERTHNLTILLDLLLPLKGEWNIHLMLLEFLPILLFWLAILKNFPLIAK